MTDSEEDYSCPSSPEIILDAYCLADTDYEITNKLRYLYRSIFPFYKAGQLLHENDVFNQLTEDQFVHWAHTQYNLQK